MNQKTMCFSGHRPKGLPWKGDERDERCEKLVGVINAILEEKIKEGFDYFISGMAIGVDTLCAEAVLRLREVYPHIKLECALPCIDQTEKWHDEQIERYSEILKKADKVYYSSDKEYFRDCMNLRNKYMVDNSDLLLAVWNGKKGGTANTVKYARKKEKEVVIINPDTI